MTATVVGPIPIQQVLADVRAMSSSEFVDAYGPMVLVRMRSGIDAEAMEKRDEESWSFGTVNVQGARSSGPIAGIVDMHDGVAYPVRKVHARFFSRTILLGRASSNDLHIADPGVSKLHARFRFDGDRLLIEDAGSSNGTFLNGQRVTTERPVQDSDVLSFGALRFRVLRAANLYAFLKRLGPA